MSKVRDLPELSNVEQDDLLYAVEEDAGPNGGRKVKISTIRTAVELTDLEVKTKYENNADTNAFTDTEKTKLAGIETGATADQNAAEVPYNNSVSGLSAIDVQDAIDEVNVHAQADFRPSIVSGRILHYTGGTVRFDGIFYQLVGNDILLNSSVTNGEVYVDLDGIVKQTGSGILAPPYTVVFAKFSTDLNNIISLVDERVKNAQNIVRGILTDVRDVRAGAAASEGTSGRVSDAMHKHNVLTAAPATQTPDQTNTEGTSTSLARADHIHNIPADAPTTTLSPATTNAEGAGSAFARNDHTHAVATGLVGEISTIQPDDAATAGVVDKFARADHKHAIAAAAPITPLSPATTDAEGSGTSFARNDHTHSIATGLIGDISTIDPDDGPSAGVVDRFARADHQHAIVAAAPTTTLSPATTNAEGVATSFARSDHTHAVGTALIGDISTIQPDDAAAAGTANTFARGDHKHAIAAAAPSSQTPDQANAEGASTSFARADHVHNIPADAPTTTLAPSVSNAEGVGVSFARNDHTHAIATGLDADVSTILPDDTAATGAIDKFSKAGHKHAIATAAPVTQNPDQANAKGTSTSFARADHVHNIPADVASSISTSTTNAEGTGTSFARNDHTHAVTVASSEATATADDTTTSATDVLMNSMTLTPGAGTYLAMWSGATVNSGNGAERTFISLYANGTQVTATERVAGTSGGAYAPMATQAVITVAAAQAIEIRWRATAGTSTVHSRRLTLIRLSN